MTEKKWVTNVKPTLKQWHVRLDDSDLFLKLVYV